MSDMNKSEGDETTVVHIISQNKLVINKNPIKDIEIGDKFLVYELTEEITDPNSSESLGRLKIYKGSGEVEEIQDTMAIVESDRESLQSLVYAVIALGGERAKMPFNDPKRGDKAIRVARAKDIVQKSIKEGLQQKSNNSRQE